MRTFRDEVGEKTVVGRVLDRANRTYSRDNLDPSDTSNYLQDFLALHGDEPARAIGFLGGDAHAAGRGIYFIPAPWACHECGGPGDRLSMPNLKERTVHITCTEHNQDEVISWDDALLHYPEEVKKMRRQIENRLRKNPFSVLVAESVLWKN